MSNKKTMVKEQMAATGKSRQSALRDVERHLKKDRALAGAVDAARFELRPLDMYEFGQIHWSLLSENRIYFGFHRTGVVEAELSTRWWVHGYTGPVRHKCSGHTLARDCWGVFAPDRVYAEFALPEHYGPGPRNFDDFLTVDAYRDRPRPHVFFNTAMGVLFLRKTEEVCTARTSDSGKYRETLLIWSGDTVRRLAKGVRRAVEEAVPPKATTITDRSTGKVYPVPSQYEYRSDRYLTIQRQLEGEDY